jgi:hypothetical protein
MYPSINIEKMDVSILVRRLYGMGLTDDDDHAPMRPWIETGSHNRPMDPGIHSMATGLMPASCVASASWMKGSLGSVMS